jgi:hypothetical protein
VGKSLDSVHYADELMQMFPDMLFLNVLRDPRAQISSMNKAIIHDFDSLLNALTWVEAYKAGNYLAAGYPDRVLTIRYEDFVADQESVLRSVCRFFDIPFSTDMLDVSRSGEAQQIAGLSALWESNCYPPIAANVDKFKKILGMDEIRVIETVCGPFMDMFEYERMTTGKVDITPERIEQARRDSAQRRQQAWAELSAANPRDYVLRRYRADYLRSVQERLEREPPGASPALG